MISPDGRVVMISGANRGIGLATAMVLGQMGYTLSYSERDLRFERLVARVGFDAASALMPANNPIQEPLVPTGRLGPAFRPTPIPAPVSGEKQARAKVDGNDGSTPAASSAPPAPPSGVFAGTAPSIPEAAARSRR